MSAALAPPAVTAPTAPTSEVRPSYPRARRFIARESPTAPPRSECADAPRPCERSCRYQTENPLESCALDVAERGGATLDEVGGVLGLSRERVRQIETGALERLNRRLRLAGLSLESILAPETDSFPSLGSRVDAARSDE